MDIKEIDKYFKDVPNHEMIEICEPLFKAFGLNYFGYVRVYTNGSRFFLTNKPEFPRWVIETQCTVAHSISNNVKPGLYLPYHLNKYLPSKEKEKDLFQSLGARNNFNFDMIEKGCTIITRCNEFYETYDFSAPTYSNFNADFYTNHIEALKHFISYFKHQSQRLLMIANKNN